MSLVTNIMLTGIALEMEHSSSIIQLNTFLQTFNRTCLVQVDGHSAGPKAFEMDLYIAGVNYLAVDEFIELFESLYWGYSTVTLFVNRQDDGHFETHIVNPPPYV